METHIHTGQRRYLTVDGLVSLLIAIGSAATAIGFWHLWSPTNDGQLGLAMFSLGAIGVTALRDFWEGSEVLVHLEPPEALVYVDHLREADDEPLEMVVERLANQAPDADR